MMLWFTHPVFTSEFGDSGSLTFHVRVTLLLYQPFSPSGEAGVRVYPIVGRDGSMMLYVSLAEAVRPPVSV